MQSEKPRDPNQNDPFKPIAPVDPNRLGSTNGPTDSANVPPVYRQEDGRFYEPDQFHDPSQPRPSLAERLLSPESLQRLMLIGGGLLVAGFLVWLKVWTVFKEPLVVAAAMGVALTAIIGGGVALIRHTRYQLAGTGLAFLGTMAMPLQLWFYDAQGLITLNAGGHLWVPAAMFCGIYAAVARVTKNSLFVYPLVGGIVMTGMLFMADLSVNQFWNIIPQVTLLVSTGWVCVFARWLFAESPTDGAEGNQAINAVSEFSRARYGVAFFRAGTTLVTGGLSLLMAGQLFAWFGLAFMPWMHWEMGTPDKLWALVTVAGSAVGCAAVSRLSKENGLALTTCFALTAWSALILVEWMNITLTLNMAIVAVAAAIIAINASGIVRLAGRIASNAKKQTKAGENNVVSTLSDFTIMGSLLLATATLVQFTDFEIFGSKMLSGGSSLWMALQYLLCGIAAATTAVLRVHEKQHTASMAPNSDQSLSASMMAWTAGGIAAMAMWTIYAHGAATTLVVIAVAGWLLPLAALVAAELTMKDVAFSKRWKPLIQNGASAMTSMHLSCVAGALFLGLFGGASTLPISVSCFCMIGLGLAAVNYSMAGQGTSAGFHQLLSLACASSSVGFALRLIGFSAEYSLLLMPLIGGVGAVLLSKTVGKDAALGHAGRSLIVLGHAAIIFFAVGQAANHPQTLVTWSLVGLMIVHIATAVCAGLLSKQEAWRTVFALMAAIMLCCNGVLVHILTGVAWYLKAEAATVLVGTGLLVYGVRGWAKETDQTRSTNSVSLWFGSLLAMVPVIVMLMHYRFGLNFAETSADQWLAYSHEIFAIGIALALCAVGVMCKLRSATLVGGAGLAIYLISLFGMINFPAALQNVAVLMMIGGGLFFGVGILLSIYRDYVISLPTRVKEGKGLFQILKWR